MKKIIIDNSNLFTGGGIQVAASFLDDLKKLSDSVDCVFHVIQSYNCTKAIDKTAFPNSFVFYDLESNINQLKKIQKVKQIEDNIMPDVIFTTFGPSYHKSKFPKIVGFAIPYIIYPGSPFFKKISWKEKWKYKIMGYLKTKFFITNSDALIFESEVARDIFVKKNKLKKNTFVVNNTLNSIFLSQDLWKNKDIEKSQLDIFCLSANYPHKNLDIIPQVIDEILKKEPNLDFTFHISGKEAQFNFHSRYNKYLNFIGTIPRQELPTVYQKMDMLFMPTLLEVFSTTYLEAMFMKIPIVSSDMPFAREICGDAAIYAKPTDPIDYAKQILKLYKDKKLCEILINNGSQKIKKYGTSIDRTNTYLEIIQKYATNTK